MGEWNIILEHLKDVTESEDENIAMKVYAGVSFSAKHQKWTGLG